ncbi:hypothetical protein JCM3774_001245 [Rhodotorula dairenensis]
MSRHDAPPRHRPEPLALGAGPHRHHHQPLQQPLYSAPLPHMTQPAYAYPSQQQQYAPAPATAVGSRFRNNPQTAAALAEFQHAQQVYLAELNRTIEHQILVQQQVEREAAYRMLALQQQQREQYGLHHAQSAPTPAHSAAAGVASGGYAPFAQGQVSHHRQQEQQQQQGYALGQGYGQQHVPLTQQATNPLVASALARRQRQDLAAPPHLAAPQGLTSHSGPVGPSRGYVGQACEHQQASHRTTPSPPAVILSAPGEPYPDTSSSGSDSGETRPTSPESLAHAVFCGEGGGESSSNAEVKAARRRSHLDALTNTVEHAERRRRRRPVSIAGPADLHTSVSSPFSSQQQQHQPAHQQYHARPHQQQLSPRWPSDGSRERLPAPRATSDPLLSAAAAPPAQLAPPFRSHSAASATSSSSSSSATVVPPTPAPAAPTTIRVGPPPVPGTASAVRQPRGPPTDLDAAQTNFASRIRARAIENLKARSARGASTPAPAPALVATAAASGPPQLAADLAALRLAPGA